MPSTNPASVPIRVRNPPLADLQHTRRESPRTSLPMKYEYKPLDDASTSIRVIRVLPATQIGLIECTIEHLPRKSWGGGVDGSYYALSYVWGSADVLYKIIIDGATFEVRKNLYNFLQYAQKHRPDQNIWVDAICIDQKNLAERNQQVQQMGKVYRNVKSLLIFLHVELSCPEALAEICSEIRKRESDIYATHLMASAGVGDRKDPITTFWSDIQSIYTNEYWSRTWIIQEITLASRHGSVMICGNVEVEWLSFQRMMKYIPHSLFSEPEASKLKASRLVFLVSYLITHNAMYTIEDALEVSRQSTCFDLRDRIFGILSIAEDSRCFPVDYALNTLDLFYYTVLHFGRRNEKFLTDLFIYLADALNLSEEEIYDSVDSFPEVYSRWLAVRGKTDLVSPSDMGMKVKEWCSQAGAIQASRNLVGHRIQRRGSMEVQLGG